MFHSDAAAPHITLQQFGFGLTFGVFPWNEVEISAMMKGLKSCDPMAVRNHLCGVLDTALQIPHDGGAFWSLDSVGD